MNYFDAFLTYFAGCEMDIQAFFGAFYSDGYITIRGIHGNSRFQFNQGFGNQGGLGYFNLVFFPMMALLAPRFRASLEPYIGSSIRNGTLCGSWSFDSCRSIHWTYLRSITYIDGVKVVPVWLAAMFNEVFIAYLAMGDATWQSGGSIKFCTQSFQPGCLAVLQAVLRRHGIHTVIRDKEMMKCGRVGQVLIIPADSRDSILRMQDIARRHFCPEMMYRAGLNSDGTPFKSGP